jgi:hypothetical protein
MLRWVMKYASLASQFESATMYKLLVASNKPAADLYAGRGGQFVDGTHIHLTVIAASVALVLLA